MQRSVGVLLAACRRCRTSQTALLLCLTRLADSVRLYHIPQSRRYKYPFHTSRAQPALRTTFYYLCHFDQMSNANARRNLFRIITCFTDIFLRPAHFCVLRLKLQAVLLFRAESAFHPTPLRLSPEFNHKKTLPEGSAYCFKLLSYLPFLSSFEGLALSPPETCTAISSISPLSLGLTMRRTMNAMKNAPARLNSTIEAMLFSSQLSSP